MGGGYIRFNQKPTPMKKLNADLSGLFARAVASIAIVTFPNAAWSQADHPYSICNINSAAGSFLVEYKITVQGTSATYGPVQIFSGNCFNIPLADFSAVGYIQGSNSAEVEVVAVGVNFPVPNFSCGFGDCPIVSSVIPNGAVYDTNCPPGGAGAKCYTCFSNGGAVSGFAWTSTNCDIW